jgi:hypothetical protein
MVSREVSIAARPSLARSTDSAVDSECRPSDAEARGQSRLTS